MATFDTKGTTDVSLSKTQTPVITPFSARQEKADTTAADLLTNLGQMGKEAWRTSIETKFAEEAEELVKSGIHRKSNLEDLRGLTTGAEHEQDRMLLEQSAEFDHDPAVEGFKNEVNRLSKAVSQGSMTKTALAARVDALTRSYKNNYPALSSEIGRLRSEVMGDWSNEITAAYPPTSTAKQPFEDLYDDLPAEIKSVVGVPDATGGVDYKTAWERGSQMAKSQYNIRVLKDNSDAQTQLTQQQSVELHNNMQGLLSGHLGGLTTKLINLAQADQEQAMALLPQVAGLVQEGRNTVDRVMSQFKGTVEQEKQIKESLNKQLDTVAALFTDKEFSIVAQNAKAVQYLENTIKLSALEAAPIIARMSAVGGDRAVAALIEGNLYNVQNQKVIENFNTQVRQVLRGKDKGTYDLANFVDILEGNKDYDSLQDPEDRREAFLKVEPMVRGYQDKTTKLSPIELKAWGNSTAYLSAAIDGDQNPSNIQNFYNKNINAKWRQTFDKYAAQGDAYSVEVTADATNRTIATTMPTMFADARVAASTQYKNWNVVYNSTTGEFSVDGGTPTELGGQLRLSAPELSTPPPALLNKLASMNQALATSAHLKDYGEVTKEMTPKQVKQFVAQNVAGAPTIGTDHLADFKAKETPAARVVDKEAAIQALREQIAKTGIELSQTDLASLLPKKDKGKNK